MEENTNKEVAKETVEKTENFAVKENAPKKKGNFLKILLVVLVLAVLAIAGFLGKLLLVDKMTLGEVIKMFMGHKAPIEKLVEASQNTLKSEELTENATIKFAKVDTSKLGLPVSAFGVKPEKVDKILENLEVKVEAKKKGKDQMLLKAELFETNKKESVVQMEALLENGKKPIVKLFGDENLVLAGEKLDFDKQTTQEVVEKYMNVIGEAYTEIKKNHKPMYTVLEKHLLNKFTEEGSDIKFEITSAEALQIVKEVMTEVEKDPEIVKVFGRSAVKVMEITKDVAGSVSQKEIDKLKQEVENTDLEKVKKDAKKALKNFEQIEKQAEQFKLKFAMITTLKASKYDKIRSTIDFNDAIKVETETTYDYGKVSIDGFKYNKEVLEGGAQAERNVINQAMQKIQESVMKIDGVADLMKDVQSRSGLYSQTPAAQTSALDTQELGQPVPATQPTTPALATGELTFNQKNAVKKAESYSKYSHMSKQGIIDQLSSKVEGFTKEEAEYGVSQISADWKKNALEKAKSYSRSSSMSKKAIYDQLIWNKFTAEEAQYAIDNLE